MNDRIILLYFYNSNKFETVELYIKIILSHSHTPSNDCLKTSFWMQVKQILLIHVIVFSWGRMQQRVLQKNAMEGSAEEYNIGFCWRMQHGFCRRLQHRVLQKNATVQRVLQWLNELERGIELSMQIGLCLKMWKLFHFQTLVVLSKFVQRKLYFIALNLSSSGHAHVSSLLASEDQK